MSTLSTKLLVLAFASVALASQACTLASPTEVKMVPASADDDDDDKQASDATESTKSASSTSDKAGSCSGAKLVKADLSKLTACGDGAGHCYAKSKLPASAAANMIACDKAGEVCVQDAILEAAGGKLKSCKVAVLSNAAGACIALGTMPEGSDKDQAKANLKQDVCDAGQVCAPCTNPLQNNADTGICGAIGVSDSECGGASSGTTTTAPAKAAPACCGGKGSCLDSKALGEGGKDLKADSCSDGLVCAPTSLVTNKAVKCSSGFLGNGICMGKCFNDMLSGIGGIFLSQDKCADEELCIPCTFASQMAPDGTKVPGCE